MANLEGNLKDISREFFNPYYNIKSWDDFKRRTWKYVTGEKKAGNLVTKIFGKDELGYEVKEYLTHAPEGEKRKEIESKLEEITRKNWEEIGHKYFKERPILPKLARYGALGFGLYGGVTAAAGILATAPVSIAASIGCIAVAGIINVATDIYEALRAQKHTSEQKEDPEEQNRPWYLKILKKVSDGAKYVWNTVTAPVKAIFSKKTAPGMFEGILTNTAPYGALATGYSDYLIDLLGSAMGPMHAASMVAPIFAFNKGGKKFDHVVINYIRQKSQKEFIEYMRGIEMEKTKEDYLFNGIQTSCNAANQHIYDVSRQQHEAPIIPLKKVEPRKTAEFEKLDSVA